MWLDNNLPPFSRLSLILATFVNLSTSVDGQSSENGTCISLASSRLCPAFNGSFVSTTSSYNLFESYIQDEYVQTKYQNILGCTNLNLTNTDDLYARYTTSVLCNAMVQQAASICGAEAAQKATLCADTCAQFAMDEQIISFDPATCNSTRNDRTSQIRSDFTICALPANSLSGSCIEGKLNELTNCGYGNNLPGLCSYCGSNSPNSTDSCCYSSNLTACAGVRLPPTISLAPLFTQTVTATPTSNSTNSAGAVVGHAQHHRLSGGAIAGIVVGSIVGLMLLALLVFFLLRKNRRTIQRQVSPVQRATIGPQPSMAYNPVTSDTISNSGGGRYETLPNSRIARMSALEGNGNNGISPTNTQTPNSGTSHLPVGIAGAGNFSSSSPSHPTTSEETPSSRLRSNYSPSTEARSRHLPTPRGVKNTSVSSHSLHDQSSSSPMPELELAASSTPYGGSSSQQSEQLTSFKDYYSHEEIHKGDIVATLWAYAPRASDEFELERGDMLQVVGIWDDGWATGVRIKERMDDKRTQTGGSIHATRPNRRDASPIRGEIKAFPLVCVCLPSQWQQTIEQENDTYPAGEDETPGSVGGPAKSTSSQR